MLVQVQDLAGDKAITTNPQVAFTNTTFAQDSFWSKRRNVVRSTTLRYQLDMLKQTGRYDAFNLKWQKIYDESPIHNRHVLSPYLFCQVE